MKKIFFSIKLFVFFFLFQENINSAIIQNKIIANVGSEIITSYELKDKIKTVLFLSNQTIDQKNVNATKGQALRALINIKLKKQEVDNYKLKLEKNEQVTSYLNNLALKYNSDIQGLENIFLKNNLDFELFLNEIMIEIAWQSLIFSFFSDKIILNEKEIDDQFNKIIESKKNLEEYNLAEIEIILDNKDDQKQINEIKEQIKQNGFKNTAIKYSSSSSSLDGGDLGWINSKSLSEDILNKIKNIKIGDVTNPIRRGNTLTFIKLLNKKLSNVADINVEEIKKQIITRKKNEFLNLYSNNHLSKIKNRSLIEVK